MDLAIPGGCGDCCDRRMRRNRLLLYARFAAFWLTTLLSGLGKTDGYEPPAVPATDGTIAQFKVEPRGAPLILPVTIGDASYPFLLDTGTVSCVFDDSLKGHLELAPDAKFPGGPEPPSKLYRPPPMRLGSMLIGPKPGFIYPGFHDVFVPLGLEVHGVIGMNALLDQVISIDFDNGVIRFLNRATADLGAAIRMEWKSARFHVVGEIAGNRGETFLIDTGHCGFDTGSIRRELFDRMLASGALRLFTNRRDTAWRFGGAVPIRVAETRGFSIGPFTHDRLIVNDDKHFNSLGLGHLSRFTVTFDFPQSTMYLRPGKEFNRADRCDLSGIGLARIYGKTLVSRLDPGSVGASAGLQKWDEILSIDGMPTPTASIFELCRLFTEPGQRRLVLSREGVQKEVVVVLHGPQTASFRAPADAKGTGRVK
jgi:hypothetical protein